MCQRYLGDEFDIHGGGLDLIFPHHENEIAQSQAAGLGFARYWVHHALLNLGSTKMSKSLGNVIDLDAVVAYGYPPGRAALLPGRPALPLGDRLLRVGAARGATAYQRIEGFVRRAAERVGAVEPGALPAEFVAAMDDDLNTSRALAVRARGGPRGQRRARPTAATSSGRSARCGRCSAIFGVDPFDPHWAGDAAVT